MDAGAVPLLAQLLEDEKAQVTAAGALRNLAAQNVANQAGHRLSHAISDALSTFFWWISVAFDAQTRVETGFLLSLSRSSGQHVTDVRSPSAKKRYTAWYAWWPQASPKCRHAAFARLLRL